MKCIELNCFGIIVEFDTETGSGQILTSDLHEDCDDEGHELHDAAMDAIESIILAHACAGVDISSPAYVEGIETAVIACGNNL